MAKFWWSWNAIKDVIFLPKWHTKNQQQILPSLVSGSADLVHKWLTSARATSIPSLARHGSSTQSACYTTSNWVVSILLRTCKTLLVERTSYFDLEFAYILSLWTICLGPRRRAPHREKLGMNNNEMKKPAYRVAPFSLLFEVFTE